MQLAYAIRENRLPRASLFSFSFDKCNFQLSSKGWRLIFSFIRWKWSYIVHTHTLQTLAVFANYRKLTLYVLTIKPSRCTFFENIFFPFVLFNLFDTNIRSKIYIVFTTQTFAISVWLLLCVCVTISWKISRFTPWNMWFRWKTEMLYGFPETISMLIKTPHFYSHKMPIRGINQNHRFSLTAHHISHSVRTIPEIEMKLSR